MKATLFRFLLSTGILVILTPFLNAWSIGILNPETLFSYNNNTYSLPDGSSFKTFKGYLDNTGSTLITGSLGSYLGGADAIIVNLPSDNGYYYTQAEMNVLKGFLNSNIRVLLISENTSWSNSNTQLAQLLGGTNNGSGKDPQSIINQDFPEITDGVNNVSFAAPGKVSPNGDKGISLTSDNSITLWGDNNNFLLFMDVNALSDKIKSGDNDRLAQNIAHWLTGSSPTIPEPSSYALLLGVASVTTILLRRQRKNETGIQFFRN